MQQCRGGGAVPQGRGGADPRSPPSLACALPWTVRDALVPMAKPGWEVWFVSGERGVRLQPPDLRTGWDRSRQSAGSCPFPDACLGEPPALPGAPETPLDVCKWRLCC